MLKLLSALLFVSLECNGSNIIVDDFGIVKLNAINQIIGVSHKIVYLKIHRLVFFQAESHGAVCSLALLENNNSLLY